MKEHDDVYQLIAATSETLKMSVMKLGPGVKHPKPVTDIVESLKDAHDCQGTIDVMKGFILQHGH